MQFSSLIGAGIFLMLACPVLAQTPSYKNVGRTPAKQEIEAWDISIGPDGKGLPPGQGSAKDGAPIFAAKCAVCHGDQGRGAKSVPVWSEGFQAPETLTTLRPVRSVAGAGTGHMRRQSGTSSAARCRATRPERSRRMRCTR